MIIDVMKYGALGDGATNDRDAIQRAINDCGRAGGGRVVFSGGHVFRSGALELASNIELYLEAGAVLKAVDDMEELDLFGQSTGSVKALSRPTYEACDYDGAPTMFFLYGNELENVTISGRGRIDGNEEIFYGTVTKWHIDGKFYPRAPLIYMVGVKHLTIEGVTLCGSAFWTTHLIGCEDVLIQGVRILNNLRLANCDGIDPDHCKNVRIIGCNIETADDCIVFKNTAQFAKYGACENIVVSGCTLKSTSAAIKFGSESEDVFRNIVVENCTIDGTNRGISLQLRDKGCIENVILSNLIINTRMFSKLHWWGSAEPIAVTAVRRTNDTKPGCIRNVTFSNIRTNGENGIFIYGDEELKNIDGLLFERVCVTLSEKTGHPKDTYDIRPTAGEGLIKDSLRVLSVHNTGRIAFKDCSFTIEDSMAPFVNAPVSIENAEVEEGYSVTTL